VKDKFVDPTFRSAQLTLGAIPLGGGEPLEHLVTFANWSTLPQKS
jgi:hypothetical protein